MRTSPKSSAFAQKLRKMLHEAMAEGGILVSGVRSFIETPADSNSFIFLHADNAMAVSLAKLRSLNRGEATLSSVVCAPVV